MWYDTGMARKLRFAFSVACGIVCLALLVLWTRSYRAEDRASWRLGSVGIRVYSSRGWLVLFKNSTPGAGPYDWDITLGSDYWLNPPDARLAYALPLRFFGRTTISNISLPHWVVATACVALATVPWLLHRRFRFSLRTLLLATTLVAVVLGVAVALQ
jgi:hypothetical protein